MHYQNLVLLRGSLENAIQALSLCVRLQKLVDGQGNLIIKSWRNLIKAYYYTDPNKLRMTDIQYKSRQKYSSLSKRQEFNSYASSANILSINYTKTSKMLTSKIPNSSTYIPVFSQVQAENNVGTPKNKPQINCTEVLQTLSLLNSQLKRKDAELTNIENKIRSRDERIQSLTQELIKANAKIQDLSKSNQALQELNVSKLYDSREQQQTLNQQFDMQKQQIEALSQSLYESHQENQESVVLGQKYSQLSLNFEKLLKKYQFAMKQNSSLLQQVNNSKESTNNDEPGFEGAKDEKLAQVISILQSNNEHILQLQDSRALNNLINCMQQQINSQNDDLFSYCEQINQRKKENAALTQENIYLKSANERMDSSYQQLLLEFQQQQQTIEELTANLNSEVTLNEQIRNQLQQIQYKNQQQLHEREVRMIEEHNNMMLENNQNYIEKQQNQLLQYQQLDAQQKKTIQNLQQQLEDIQSENTDLKFQISLYNDSTQEVVERQKIQQLEQQNTYLKQQFAKLCIRILKQ